MRIIITGDRFWACHRLAAHILGRLVKRYGPEIVIVHGPSLGLAMTRRSSTSSMHWSRAHADRGGIYAGQVYRPQESADAR